MGVREDRKTRELYKLVAEQILKHSEIFEGEVVFDWETALPELESAGYPFSEWHEPITAMVMEARITVVWGDIYHPLGQHDACPYDCDGCHDDDHCNCLNCDRRRTEREAYEAEEENGSNG